MIYNATLFPDYLYKKKTLCYIHRVLYSTTCSLCTDKSKSLNGCTYCSQKPNDLFCKRRTEILSTTKKVKDMRSYFRDTRSLISNRDLSVHCFASIRSLTINSTKSFKDYNHLRSFLHPYEPK